MGIPKEPERVILFTGLLYTSKSVLHDCLKKLSTRFGSLLFESPDEKWDHSEYYREEMGWPIYRKFCAFNRLINPEEIVDIKLWTNAVEQEYAESGKRKINIDPGYLALSKVVLATTKNYAHRIYLGKGIYGEVTLYYRKGGFISHDFTYPDYQTKLAMDFFNKLRIHLKEMLQNE